MNSMRASPHAVAGQSGQAERLVGIADVEHDGGGGPGHLGQLHAASLEGQRAPVDGARLALRARHRDHVTIGEGGGRPLRAHDARHSELPADDRGMAGAAATVGHDGGHPLHHGLPVGIGHGRHEHLARLDVLQVGALAHAPGRPHADLLADGLAGHDRGGVGDGEREDLHGLGPPRPVHGLRSRLQDVESPIDAVPRPLDVHRGRLAVAPGVVRLDGGRRPGELHGLRVAQAQDAGLVGGDLGALRTAVGVQDELPGLGPDGALENGAGTPRQGRLEEPERVGIDLPAHHGLAEPVGGLDQDHPVEAAVGVEREHHAGDTEVGAHHALHADGQPHGEMIEPVVDAIGDRPVGEQRGEAAPARADQGVGPAHPEERLLLSGEARLGQVLRRRAGPHGDRDAARRALAQRRVGIPHESLEIRRPGASSTSARRAAPDVASRVTSRPSMPCSSAVMRSRRPPASTMAR